MADDTSIYILSNLSAETSGIKCKTHYTVSIRCFNAF